jgi:hypothetical protein
MPDQLTSFITSDLRGRKNASSCERRHRTGDSAEKHAERRSGDPAERDALAGILLEGLRLFDGQRRR